MNKKELIAYLNKNFNDNETIYCIVGEAWLDEDSFEYNHSVTELDEKYINKVKNEYHKGILIGFQE